MREVPDWKNYWMAMAEQSATRSKDPNTQVGAFVVSEDNRPLGCGYNGMPPGYEEDIKLWERPIKYDHVIHAEVNAILNCKSTPINGELYVTLYPCKECAKIIAAARIKKIYYKHHTINNKLYLDYTSFQIFQRAGIKVEQI